MIEFNCFECGKKNNIYDKVGFRSECDCGADLHCCRNCKFFDVKAYNSCREPSADFIQEKDRANYCDYYQPGAEGSLQVGLSQKEDLKAKAEALFKKK